MSGALPAAGPDTPSQSSAQVWQVWDGFPLLKQQKRTVMFSSSSGTRSFTYNPRQSWQEECEQSYA